MKPESISWFDDRFYRVLVNNKICEAAKKHFQKINPTFELLIIPSDKKGESYIYLPSSTTILSSAPKDWVGKWRGQVGNWEADRIMNEAMDKGSRIHSAFAGLINGVIIILNESKNPKYSREQIEVFSNESKKGVIVLTSQQEMLEVWRLQRFFEIIKPKIIANEMTVYSEKHFYAGTLDHLWYIEAGEYNIGDKEVYTFEKSGVYLLDIKTGGEDTANYPEQLASYWQAVQESSEHKIEGALILYSNADKKRGIEGFKAEMLSIDDLKYHFEGFIYQYNVWIKKAKKTPKVFELPTILRMN